MPGSTSTSGSTAGSPSGHLVLAGTSHHVAPVAVRERLLEKGGERAAELLGERVREQFGPAVILSTCNRLEVYCWTSRRPPAATAGIVRLLAAWSGLSRQALRPHLYVHRNLDAAQHLVRVAAGLDSLALGETQILGQVRDAWQAAAQAAPLGPELNSLFGRAIDAARRIRAQGALGRHPSVAGIAVHAAAQAFGNLAGRPAAVLGAGVTGKTAARALLAAGAAHVTLLNRSLGRAAAAADWLGAGDRVAAAGLDDLPRALAEVDVLICATAAPTQVVSAAAVAGALPARGGRRLAILDVAVPRDVDVAVRDLPGVRLIDLDDLEAQCALDGAARRREVERAETLAATAARACMAALQDREAIPDIVALRGRAEAIRAAELRRVAGKLSRLAPEEQAAVEQLTYSIVQKLLHGPVVALRQTTALPGAAGRRARAAIMAALQPSTGTRPVRQE